MPYSGGSDPKLPANVKKLSAKRRRQWVHVWQSMMDRTGDESKAFAAANSVVKRKKELDMALTRTEKSVKVTMYTGTDDPDLPDHVKQLPKGMQTRWVSNYNWAVQDLMDDTEAEERADEYTSMSVDDLLEAGLIGKGVKEHDDGPEETDDEEEAEDAGDEEEAEAGVVQATKAELTAKKRNKLSKGQFAYVDAEGKGHLPIHDASHVRNAMARFNQTDMPSSAKASARRKILAAAKRHGVKAETFASKEQGPTWVDRLKAWFSPAPTPVYGTLGMFTVYKATDGSLRVLTVYSNVFKDNHKEIISTAAHEEYSAAAESGDALYPDLYLWHGGPATKWGTVETVSFVDGFAVAGGVVDPGKEDTAYTLKEMADKGELAVSFGFYGLRGPDGVYHLYRPFEISPLPVGSEANPWTSIDFTSANKENGMAFSTKKKEWLKTHFKMDDTAIAAAEKSFEDMGAKLKTLGVEYKEEGETPPPTPPTPPTPPPEPPSPQPPPPPAADTSLMPQLTAMAKAVEGLATVVGAMAGEIKAIKEGAPLATEKAAEELVLARIAGAPGGFSPTRDGGNVQRGMKDAEDDWLTAAIGNILPGMVPGGGGAAVGTAPVAGGEVK
jgi:hypothetical protein